MKSASVLRAIVGLLLPAAAQAQQLYDAEAPVVDTIVIITHNVFGPAEADANIFFRAANSVHVTTRAAVVRRELLFHTGEPYDDALVAETERNLRRLGIFRDVDIDTTRIGSKLAVVVQTADGWTTQVQLSAYSTGGTFSWSAGLAERNLVGTATRAGAFYRDEPDRTATTFTLGMDRTLGSAVAVTGVYDKLSDGLRGGVGVGVPWRALTDRQSWELRASAGRERILLYRGGVLSDSVQRRSLIQSGYVAHAVSASTAGYVRLGFAGQVVRMEHVAYADTGLLIPDSLIGAVGLFGEISRARYKVVTHYNGFARDFDVDLSSRLSMSAWLAPAAFGYEESGVGAEVGLQGGLPVGAGFAFFRAKANALYTASGVDSGQAWVGLTVATMPFRRNATVFHIQMGAQRGVAPGGEFDIGHGFGPRAFKPHAFTGSRMIWGSVEHRGFMVDEVLGLLGVGFAAFVDYGGAWFADQPRRLGGDVGLGLRLGATRATGPNVGRLDLAYRFGEGFAGNRWVVSFGRGFAF
jgi:hypothetical protein